MFSEYQDGRQTGTAWYAAGGAARQAGPVGEILAESIPVSFDGRAQPVQVSGYSPEAARAAALQVLPDVLHYDRTQSATYPNGRVPTDDMYSMRFAWLTNGKVPPDGLKPHDDLLAHFPYLGPPNP